MVEAGVEVEIEVVVKVVVEVEFVVVVKVVVGVVVEVGVEVGVVLNKRKPTCKGRLFAVRLGQANHQQSCGTRGSTHCGRDT